MSRNWRQLADDSDERASRLRINAPRPGRKSYQERYAETASLSNAEIDAIIARREAAGEECGVLYRIMADRNR